MFNLIRLNSISDLTKEEMTLIISVSVLVVIIILLLVYLFFAKDSKKKKEEVIVPSTLDDDEMIEIYELKDGEIETSIVNVNHLVAKEYSESELEFEEYNSIEELKPEFDSSEFETQNLNSKYENVNEIQEETNNIQQPQEEIIEEVQIMDVVDNFHDELRDKEETNTQLIIEDSIEEEKIKDNKSNEVELEVDGMISNLSSDDQELFNELLKNI